MGGIQRLLITQCKCVETVEITHDVLGESVFTGQEDGLSAWVLELGSFQGFLGVLDVFRSGRDKNQNGSDFDASCLQVWFT